MSVAPAALRAALRRFGVRFVETPGWETRGYDTLDPKFVMSHHTAGSSGPTNQRDVDEVINGRPDLPGPLCNFLVAKDGTVHVIALRRARHAGPGSPAVYEAVIRDLPPSGDAGALGLRDSDSTHGNRSSWGIEVDHPGDASAYPAVQINALVRLNAALCHIGGWTANRAIMHREWTRRKIDMSWRGPLRAMVSAMLSGGPQPQPTPTPGFEEAPVQYVRCDVPRGHEEHGKVYFLTGNGRTWMRTGFNHMHWLAARGLGPKPDPARRSSPDQGFDIETWPVGNVLNFPYLGAS